MSSGPEPNKKGGAFENKLFPFFACFFLFSNSFFFLIPEKDATPRSIPKKLFIFVGKIINYIFCQKNSHQKPHFYSRIFLQLYYYNKNIKKFVVWLNDFCGCVLNIRLNVYWLMPFRIFEQANRFDSRVYKYTHETKRYEMKINKFIICSAFKLFRKSRRKKTTTKKSRQRFFTLFCCWFALTDLICVFFIYVFCLCVCVSV